MANRGSLCIPCLATGALALSALGWWAVYRSPDNAEELRVRTTGLATSALAGAFPFAKAELQGSVLRITGVAPDSQSRLAALAAVRASVLRAQGVPGVFAQIEEAVEIMARPAAEDCQARFNRTLEGKVVRFRTASAELDPGSHALLDEIAAVLRACAGYGVEVAGHTDVRGDRTMNLGLSTARAASVIQYLGGQGADTTRLSAVGYGPDRPVDSSGTAEALARNRRIEFTVKTSTPQG